MNGARFGTRLSSRRIGLLILLAALTLTGGAPEVGLAQDDCTEECFDGWWDDDFWWCIPESPQDCSECTVTCPGGGGTPPRKQQRTA